MRNVYAITITFLTNSKIKTKTKSVMLIGME